MKMSIVVLYKTIMEKHSLSFEKIPIIGKNVNSFFALITIYT